MSKASEKAWLDLFLSMWGYLPAKTIRAYKNYRGALSCGEALQMSFKNRESLKVRIVNPFSGDKFISDTCKVRYYLPDEQASIAVLPQIVHDYEHGSTRVYEIKETVLFKNILYPFEEFARIAPEPDIWALNPLWSIEISLALFFKTTNELNAYRKFCLAPVRKVLSEALGLEGRGKNKRIDVLHERNAFIKSLARDILSKSKKHLPIKNLTAQVKYRLDDEALKRYPNHATSPEDRRSFRRFSCEESTIYNLLS